MIKKIYDHILKKFFKSEYRRNVMILMTGTTIANFLPIILTPILTRFFTPEDFGAFAFYFAIVSILSILVTAGYEFAIILPKKTNDAYQLVILSCAISILISFLVLGIILIFDEKINELFKNLNVSNFLYFIPLSIFLTGVYQSLYYWFNRDKDYKSLASSNVIKSSTMVISQTGLGFLTKLSAMGLILGQVLSQIIGTLYLGQKFFRDTYLKYETKKLIQLKLLNQYKNFPKFILLANLMNASSRQLPGILFNILFTATSAGFYMIIHRVFGVPVTIFSITIGDVFRQEANNAFVNYGNCVNEYKITFKRLLAISLIPFIIFFFIAPDLFEIVFGKNWRIAGEYSKILTPMFFLRFIANPLSNMFIIAEKQKMELLLQTILFLSICCSFILGFIFEDIILTFTLFSAANCLIYLIKMLMSWEFAKGKY